MRSLPLTGPVVIIIARTQRRRRLLAFGRLLTAVIAGAVLIVAVTR